MLIAIKLVHTIVWAIMAGMIVSVPFLSFAGRFRLAGWFSAAVWAECAVLALNGGRCPLTDVAARFTPLRAPNFDIYLPVFVAQYNKVIFGTLFLVAEIVLLSCWVARQRSGLNPLHPNAASQVPAYDPSTNSHPLK